MQLGMKGMFIITSIAKLLFLSVLLFLLLAYGPYFLHINPVSIKLNPCPAFEGPLAFNSKLEKHEKFLENRLDGPESIAYYKGDLYTGLGDGRVVRIQGDKVITLTQTGDYECEGKWDEDICGRPLGMRFDKQGNLYVADAYYGLFKINIKTGEKTVLYSSKTLIDGKPSMVVNDLDITENGDIYFSDSGIWSLKRGIYGILEMTPKGRILHYDPTTNETTTVIGGINFANGIQLTPDENLLLISETGFHRILKYYLKGPKKGNLEVFADNLPGFPDNIRLNPRGGYWVGQCGTRIPGHVGLIDILGDKPLVRKVLARSIHLVQSVLENLEHMFRAPVIKELRYKIAHMQPYANQTLPHHGMIIELDGNGTVLQSFHDSTGSVRFISEILEYDGKLYLGSPWHNFMGKVNYK